MMCPIDYVHAGHDRYIVHLLWPTLLSSTPRVVRLVVRGCPVRPLFETLCGSLPVLEDVTYGWDKWTEYHGVDPATSGLQYVVETITHRLIQRAELSGHQLKRLVLMNYYVREPVHDAVRSDEILTPLRELIDGQVEYQVLFTSIF